MTEKKRVDSVKLYEIGTCRRGKEKEKEDRKDGMVDDDDDRC